MLARNPPLSNDSLPVALTHIITIPFSGHLSKLYTQCARTTRCALTRSTRPHLASGVVYLWDPCMSHSLCLGMELSLLLSPAMCRTLTGNGAHQQSGPTVRRCRFRTRLAGRSTVGSNTIRPFFSYYLI